MIFVTVGTDLPFDRLVKVIDYWAFRNGRRDVFAQVGEGGWEPEHIRYSKLLHPSEFQDYFKAASVIISHAGMGTILSALRYGKPILVMPKKASLGEHRNEHQIATARELQAKGLVNVAFDESELFRCLDHIEEFAPREQIPAFAGGKLVSVLKDFIDGY